MDTKKRFSIRITIVVTAALLAAALMIAHLMAKGTQSRTYYEDAVMVALDRENDNEAR